MELDISQRKREYTNCMISIPAFIEDVKRAIAANAQFSALCLTLALVDECATFEWRKTHPSEDYKSQKNEQAYTEWYNMWYKPLKKDDDKMKDQMKKVENKRKEYRKSTIDTISNGKIQKKTLITPQLDGKLLYKIRCSILHAVSTNIDFKNCGLEDSANRNIKDFTIVINEPNIYSTGGVSYSCDENKNASIEMTIQWLVNTLLNSIKNYYENNKDNIKFNTIKAIDFTNDYCTRKDD